MEADVLQFTVDFSLKSTEERRSLLDSVIDTL